MMRAKNRRKIFYIDKIFQKKLLILFLGINIFLVLANIIYYSLYLKVNVEENLYQSHVTILNIAEVLAGDIILFNVLLVFSVIFLGIIFYIMRRKKIQKFFNNISRFLLSWQKGKGEELSQPKFWEEFCEIDMALAGFFNYLKKIKDWENQQIKYFKEILKKHDQAQLK